MSKPKFLVVIVIICYVLFAVNEFSGSETLALHLRSLLVPFITIGYTFYITSKNNLFWAFLICYSLSDLLTIVMGNMTFSSAVIANDFEYFAGNALYILAYIFLIVKIVRLINFGYVFKYLKIHSLVLLFLNIYLFSVLNGFIKSNLVYQIDYYFELIYNVIILTLFFVGMINFFCRDNRKSLFIFLGSVSIVFSEIMDVAYIYIDNRQFLSFLSTTLMLLSFNLFYYQASMTNVNTKINNFIY
ncbi:hypothetical protein [Algibacter pectinivorans]|uniref:YhhN-like protein n=1 Tax=Algibacter pectinivorans TaxID=870482 RepID=A0A1I1R4B6_9FLAO|nr:hypothetical protein [Algibacter pectinivorans]SFD29129.1 hypothetical protein SAMN04487987_108136 [Algibacter pectinivorans]